MGYRSGGGCLGQRDMASAVKGDSGQEVCGGRCHILAAPRHPGPWPISRPLGGWASCLPALRIEPVRCCPLGPGLVATPPSPLKQPCHGPCLSPARPFPPTPPWTLASGVLGQWGCLPSGLGLLIFKLWEQMGGSQGPGWVNGIHENMGPGVLRKLILVSCIGFKWTVWSCRPGNTIWPK